MSKYDYAVTKVLEYFGSVEADSEAEATEMVRDQIILDWDEPATVDVVLNLFKVDDE